MLPHITLLLSLDDCQVSLQFIGRRIAYEIEKSSSYAQKSIAVKTYSDSNCQTC